MSSDRVHVRVVCALIERAGCVLAAQRGASQTRQGLWELPGGKIDAGESVDAAIVREISEELGCVVRPLDTLPSHTHAYPDVIVTLIPIRCAIAAGEPTPVEHAQIRWVRLGELRSLEWSAADVAVVDDYLGTIAPR